MAFAATASAAPSRNILADVGAFLQIDCIKSVPVTRFGNIDLIFFGFIAITGRLEIPFSNFMVFDWQFLIEFRYSAAQRIPIPSGMLMSVVQRISLNSVCFFASKSISGFGVAIKSWLPVFIKLALIFSII